MPECCGAVSISVYNAKVLSGGICVVNSRFADVCRPAAALARIAEGASTRGDARGAAKSADRSFQVPAAGRGCDAGPARAG
jgi:hypothetical protein